MPSVGDVIDSSEGFLALPERTLLCDEFWDPVLRRGARGDELPRYLEGEEAEWEEIGLLPLPLVVVELGFFGSEDEAADRCRESRLRALRPGSKLPLDYAPPGVYALPRSFESAPFAAAPFGAVARPASGDRCLLFSARSPEGAEASWSEKIDLAGGELSTALALGAEADLRAQAMRLLRDPGPGALVEASEAPPGWLLAEEGGSRAWIRLPDGRGYCVRLGSDLWIPPPSRAAQYWTWIGGEVSSQFTPRGPARLIARVSGEGPRLPAATAAARAALLAERPPPTDDALAAEALAAAAGLFGRFGQLFGSPSDSARCLRSISVDSGDGAVASWVPIYGPVRGAPQHVAAAWAKCLLEARLLPNHLRDLTAEVGAPSDPEEAGDVLCALARSAAACSVARAASLPSGGVLRWTTCGSIGPVVARPGAVVGSLQWERDDDGPRAHARLHREARRAGVPARPLLRAVQSASDFAPGRRDLLDLLRRAAEAAAGP